MQEIVLAFAAGLNKKPLCPQLIFDDNTRILVCLIGAVIVWSIFVEILRRFNQ